MATFYYFNGRGRGELIRLTLAAAEIEYTEVLFTERDQFLKLIDEDKLAFNQVPLLEIDGKKLVQSCATVRYLARKAGLYGKTVDEQYTIDMFFDTGRDFFQPILPMRFLDEDELLTKAKTQTLPKYLPLFEKHLAANGTGYLVGDSLTIADLSLLEALLVYVEYLGKDILNDYPAVTKFFDTVSSVKTIAAYLAGPLRKIKNDDRYISEVRRVLNWY